MVVELGEAVWAGKLQVALGPAPSAARDSSTDISAFCFVSFDWRRIIKSHKTWGIFRNCKDFPPHLSLDASFAKTRPR